MDRDGDGGDELLLEAVMARSRAYGLRGVHKPGIAALLRAVGEVIATGLSRGHGTALPGLGALSARRAGGELLPTFQLTRKFSSAHRVAQPTDFAPPQAQRVAAAQPLNFAAVCSRLDKQSGVNLARSDAQTLWDCVASCFGERARHRQRVTLDLPPVGALRCSPPPPRPSADGSPREQRLAFIFSPAFCTHVGVTAPRPGSAAKLEAQASYDREHRASRASVMAATAPPPGGQPASASRGRQARQAWGDSPRSPERPLRRTGSGGGGGGGGGQRFARSSSRGDSVVSWGGSQDGSSRAGSAGRSSSRGRPPSAGTRSSQDSSFSEYETLEADEQAAVASACRLLDVFRACDANDTGRLGAADVGPRLGAALGVDLTPTEASGIGRWLLTSAGGARSSSVGESLSRVGFVKGMLLASGSAQRGGARQLQAPPVVQKVAARALDPACLLDDGGEPQTLGNEDRMLVRCPVTIGCFNLCFARRTGWLASAGRWRRRGPAAGHPARSAAGLAGGGAAVARRRPRPAARNPRTKLPPSGLRGSNIRADRWPRSSAHGSTRNPTRPLTTTPCCSAAPERAMAGTASGVGSPPPPPRSVSRRSARRRVRSYARCRT